MGQRFAPGGCCCDRCLIASDDFQRADNTNVGTLFDERSGDWSIATNALVCTGATGVIICTTPHPDASAEAFAWAKVKLPTSGDIARVIVGRVDDNNYFFGQIRTNGTARFVRIGKVAAGVESYLTSESTASATFPDDWAVLSVCHNGSRLTASAHLTSIYDWPSRTIAVNESGVTGTQCGLAVAVQTTQLQFAAFEFQRHISTDYPNCRGCGEVCTSCTTNTTPYAVQVRFAGVANTVGIYGCASCTDLNTHTYIVRTTNACFYLARIDVCPTLGTLAEQRSLRLIDVRIGAQHPVFTNRQWVARVYRESASFPTPNDVAGVEEAIGSNANYTAPFDCSVAKTFNLASSVSPRRCDFDAATITVEPLL